MPCFAALDVSQETTAICVVDEAGRILVEKKVATCPDAIDDYLSKKAPDLVRSGSRPVPWRCGSGTSWRRASSRSCALMLGMRTQP
jgi:hypothetical protein